MGRSTRTVVLFLTPLILSTGCGGSSGTRSSGEEDYIREARRYEAEFRPSDFDSVQPPIPGNIREEPRETVVSMPDAPVSMELVSGFRVQIFSSNNIDDANLMKSEVEQHFREELFYLVYDPPTYKLRGGDFLTRYEADRFARLLKDAGYKDAWVVPERVYKNPPPRTPVPDDTPKH